MPIPIDFEKLVKLPAADGYPYSIKSEDLMKNFAWCDLLPSATTDALRVEFEEVSGETAKHRQRRIVVTGQAGSLHPWRISISPLDLGTGESWDIAGGVVRGNGGSVTVAASSATIDGGNGEIWLSVTRDETSRAVTGASISSGATMTTPSTQTTQYVLIGEIISGSAKQYAFEEMNLEELMIVENGEFSLAPFHMASRNTYATPP